MSLLFKLILAIGGAVLVFLVLWVLALRRAATSAVQQLGTAPTPAEAKIEVQGKAELEQVDAEAAEAKQEVANAKGPALVQLGIQRLFRRK